MTSSEISHAPSIKAASNSGGQTISPPFKVFQLLRLLTMDWKTFSVCGFCRELRTDGIGLVGRGEGEEQEEREYEDIGEMLSEERAR